MNRLMQILTVCALALALAAGLMTPAGSPSRTAYEAHQDRVRAESSVEKHSVLSEIRPDTAMVNDSGKAEGQIRLTIPENVDRDDVSLEQDFAHHTVSVTIRGVNESYFTDYPPVGSADHITDLYYDCEKGIGTVEFVLDGFYEARKNIQDKSLWLDFKRPHELYDKVVVIDAGHGGRDAGAVDRSGTVAEKDIALAVAEKMQKIFDASGRSDVGVYYTRTEDVRMSKEDRGAFAAEADADLFLSIHVNSTSSGRESYINGTSVLYLSTDATGQSKKFAGICLDNLLAALGSTSKGLIAGDDIYILRTASMPAALAELGFITNPEERAKLTSEDYQNAAAEALCSAVYTMLDEETRE